MRFRPHTALLAAALASSLASAAPAHAATVTVRFGLSAGRHAPTGAACPLRVTANANGLAVLDAAVRARCLESYTVRTFPFGTYVECLNRVCAAGPEALYATYWNMYENGVSTSYGVSDFRANANDELVFAYTTWLVPIS